MFSGYAGTLLLRSLLAWDMTGDAMALAYLNLAAAACLIGGSLFSGAAVDRYPRRTLMIAAHAALLAVEGAGLLLFINGQLQYYHLMLITMVMCIAFSFTNPGRTALLADAVEHSRLSKAMALMSAATNLARMVSPAIAGWLADYSGIAAAYSMLVILYSLSLVAALALSPTPANDLSGAYLDNIRQGLSYLQEHSSLRACLLFGLLPTAVIAPVQGVMVVVNDNVFARGHAGLGVLLAMLGLGGLLGSVALMVARLSSVVTPMVAGGLLLGIALIGFSWSPSFEVACALLLMSSAAAVFTQTLVQTALQMMCSHHMRGRVATFNLILIGIAPAFTLPLAWAITHVGSRWAISGFGFFTAVSCLTIYLTSTHFRQIDELTASR